MSAHDLDTHCMIRFCPSAWTPRFQKTSSCVSLAHGQRWLFSAVATSTLGNTPNLNIGFLHQKETTTRGSDEVEDEIDVGKSGPVH